MTFKNYLQHICPPMLIKIVLSTYHCCSSFSVTDGSFQFIVAIKNDQKIGYQNGERKEKKSRRKELSDIVILRKFVGQWSIFNSN